MSNFVDSAILWSNGIVMAFDRNGQQVPEYQGRGTEVIPKLRRDFPNLQIIGMDWQTDVRDGQTSIAPQLQLDS